MFNIGCTLLLFPQTKLLEKLAYILVPETEAPVKITMLDERLLATPAVALERCHAVAAEMTDAAVEALELGLKSLVSFSPEMTEQVGALEDKTDKCEDMIGTYLVKLSASQLSDEHIHEAQGRKAPDFDRKYAAYKAKYLKS